MPFSVLIQKTQKEFLVPFSVDYFLSNYFGVITDYWQVPHSKASELAATYGPFT